MTDKNATYDDPSVSLLNAARLRSSGNAFESGESLYAGAGAMIFPSLQMSAPASSRVNIRDHRISEVARG